jgi:hypothetical protein
MVESGNGAGFLLETLYSLVVIFELRRQDLERDLPVKFSVFSQVNLTHSPGTEKANNLVVTDFLAHQIRMSFLWSEHFSD